MVFLLVRENYHLTNAAFPRGAANTRFCFCGSYWKAKSVQGCAFRTGRERELTRPMNLTSGRNPCDAGPVFKDLSAPVWLGPLVSTGFKQL